MSDTRNAANRLALFWDEDSPEPLAPWSNGQVSTASVMMRRKILTQLSRRDPHRAAAEAALIQSAYSVEWDWVLSQETSNLQRVLDAMGDSGRGEAITGGYRWRIGAGGEPVGFGAVLEGVADGGRWEGRRGIFTDWTLTAERKSVVKCETTMAFREFDTEETADPFDTGAPASGRAATCLDVSATLGGDPSQPVFGLVLGFQRDAAPANFSEAGAATAWNGRLTPDIAGRIVLRATSERFDAAYRSEGLITDLALSIAIPGGSLFTVDLPNVLFKANGRTHVDENLYEHVLEWAALADGIAGEDTATLELTS